MQAQNIYFTSDTHFSQQRAFELSKRPFKSVEDMDLSIISNWNKTVTMNDIVYHAGDIGDIDNIRDILSCLNFKTLYFIPGNYERRADILVNLQEIAQTISGRAIKFCNPGAQVMYHDKLYHVVHEPDIGTVIPEYPDNVVLFGHIHGRAFGKKNGFDIGTDYHNYTPVSIEQVEWFANNGIPHWDNNVHCREAKI